MSGRLRNLLLTTSAMMPLGLVPASAGPDGATVVGGAATVQGAGTGNVVVNQSSNSAILNWNTFNIGAGETTRFNQPSSSSVMLNRVTGGLGPSQLYGTLSANGQVFLVNPDGILVGPGGRINTGGFVATTHDIKNSDFMAGRYDFTVPGRSDASIVNLGHITASSSGFAALVAPGVRNAGTITARLGTIGLAAGNGFTLDLYGDQLIKLTVGDEIAGTVKDVATGQPLRALVSNDGRIKANGGRVELTAAAARQVVDAVIKNRGTIEANSVGTHNGMIVLGGATRATNGTGAPTQTVQIGGRLSAAGKRSGTKGGTIVVTGENIEVAGARIDASGHAGGGTVLIGGDWGGSHPNLALISNPSARLENFAVPTASTLSVDAASTINASATNTGNGGKVILWSDLATNFAGTILARGGSQTGDGGFVETSSHGVLDFTGTADTRATTGAMGTLLLDPFNVTISNSATANGLLLSGTFTPNGNNSVLSVTTLQNSLAFSNVTVTTGTTGGQTGDITVAAPIGWSSASTLTLSAARNISLNGAISATNGSLALNAGNAISAVATVNVGTFTLQNGNWSQVTPTLPNFSAHDFRLSGGSFLRALGGNGSVSSPYQLTDIYGVKGIGSSSILLTKNYILANDIEGDVTRSWNAGAGFVPIGDVNNPFTGVLEGQNRTINNLLITKTAGSGTLGSVGLFGVIGTAGFVRNLGLTNAQMNVTGGADFVGAIAGQNNGTIRNSYATGFINSNSYGIGGLVGLNVGSIINSHANIEILQTTGGCIGNCGSEHSVGGIVGMNMGSISDSYATGGISSTEIRFIGGLVGYNTTNPLVTGTLQQLGPSPGQIVNSYATGNINVSGRITVVGAVGGLVGVSDGTIINSNASGSVTGNTSSDPGIGLLAWGLGGLVGDNSGNIIQSSASGTVTGNVPSGDTQILNIVGGLVGNNSGTINLSFSTGTVRGGGANAVVGGLVGVNQQRDFFRVGSFKATISDSYASGNVTGDSNSRVGGLVGSNSGTIMNSYATGDVSSSGFGIVGGLTATNTGTIIGSHASGNVRLDGGVAGGLVGLVGGLVGENLGTITQSYATGSINTGENSIVGGLVGDNIGPISQSFAMGSVSGGANSVIGGLVGRNVGTFPLAVISQSYSLGPVSGGANSYVGGLVGSNEGTVSESYSAGRVSGEQNSILGGLVAANTDVVNPGALRPFGTITNSYWDALTTGQVSSAGGSIMSTAQLTSGLPGGFDASVWTINAGTSYPYLRWQVGNIPHPGQAVLFSMLPIDLYGNGQVANLISSGAWEFISGFFSSVVDSLFFRGYKGTLDAIPPAAEAIQNFIDSNKKQIDVLINMGGSLTDGCNSTAMTCSSNQISSIADELVYLFHGFYPKELLRNAVIKHAQQLGYTVIN
jgi:filamentous hemagglutinin family protein